MSGRMDVLVPREYEANGEKKTAFTKIGAAFPSRNGDGILVTLDALPIGNRLILKPAREDGQRGGGNRGGGGGGYGDDNVPF